MTTMITAPHVPAGHARRRVGDVCAANPVHELPDVALIYTQDPTCPRDQLAIVCGPACKVAADDAWVTRDAPLTMPGIDPSAPLPRPHHERSCPHVCAYCDGRINARDDS